jgi:hypothetical protein
MDISLITKNPIAPCIILGLCFGVAGHYFETKPQIILMGVIAMFVVYKLTEASGDKIIEADLANVKNENEDLKRNLMEVYSMVQNQAGSSGPPAPIPPSLSGNLQGSSKEEEEDGKPYM